MRTSLTPRELCDEIGAWSLYNFQDQDGLEEAAPLLGFIEETQFELPSAVGFDELADACADAAIFLFDLVHRSGFPDDSIDDLGSILKSRMDLSEQTKHIYYLSERIGLLCRIVLKTRQGIRGRNSPLNSQDMARFCVSDVARSLSATYYNSMTPGCKTLYDTVCDVWESVKKRNWRLAPATGSSQMIEEVCHNS